MEKENKQTNIGDFFQAIVIETRPPSSIQKFLSQKKRKHLAFLKDNCVQLYYTCYLEMMSLFLGHAVLVLTAWTLTFYLPFFLP